MSPTNIAEDDARLLQAYSVAARDARARVRTAREEVRRARHALRVLPLSAAPDARRAARERLILAEIDLELAEEAARASEQPRRALLRSLAVRGVKVGSIGCLPDADPEGTTGRRDDAASPRAA